MRHRVSWTSAIVLSLVAAAPGSGRAQAVLGIGDDAMVLPRGALRIRVMPSWTNFSERYGLNTPNRRNGDLEPLAIDFNRDTIGVEQFENLGLLREGLRGLSGMTNWDLSLGATRLGIDANVTALPIVAELGISKKFSVGVVVPIVRTRSEAIFTVNPLGREGNVGVNPGLASVNSTLAAQNQALVDQYTNAATALQNVISACAPTTNSAGYCPFVRARAASLAAVAAQARALAEGVGQIYLNSPFVPIANTDIDVAIRQRLTFFQGQFAGLTAIGAPVPQITQSAPVAAAGQLGLNDAQMILTDPRFGVEAQPIETVTRSGIGDIEVAGKYQFLNQIGEDRWDVQGLKFRSAVTGVVRLGTGKTDSPDNFIDIGTGNGQTDLELRSQTDVVMGRRLWASVVGRYAWQLADDDVRRIAPVDRPLAALFRRRTVHRDLGDYFEFEATPRFILSDYFSVSGQYLYRNKQSDNYTGTFNATDLAGSAITLNANELNAETKQTEQRLSAGFTYSTVASFSKGQAKIPFEVMYQYGRSVRGSGGRTPKIEQSLIQLRIYTRLFGGGEAPAAAK